MFNLTKNTYDIIFKPKFFYSNNPLKFSDWATNGIYKSRLRLYELYDEKTYNNSDTFKDLVCAAAKANFINNKIRNSTDIVKTTWQIINSETGN